MELVCFDESTDCNSNAQPVISQPHHKKPQICRRTGKKGKKRWKDREQKKACISSHEPRRGETGVAGKSSTGQESNLPPPPKWVINKVKFFGMVLKGRG